MPGRFTPPMPDRLSPQWAISALTSVPDQLPAAGCTTSPAGLSMTMMLVVLVDHVERDASAGDRRLSAGRNVDRDCVAGVDAMARIADRAAVDRDRAGQDQRLEARARKLRQARCQHAVEPLAGLVRGRP